jgi:hypothetical protein
MSPDLGAIFAVLQSLAVSIEELAENQAVLVAPPIADLATAVGRIADQVDYWFDGMGQGEFIDGMSIAICGGVREGMREAGQGK